MIVLVLVVLGLALGSFVNALVWRTHERELLLEAAEKRVKKNEAPKLSSEEQKRYDELSIVRGRSMCPHCGHELAPKDLIPVVSWLMLRGRCRYCHEKFGDTPTAELLVPFLFVFSYAFWPFQMHGVGEFSFWAWLAFVVGFTALIIYDARWFTLPDRIVFPLLALAVAEVTLLATYYHQGWPEIIGAGAGLAIVSGLFYLFFVMSNGTWIGGGDVKLGAVLGLLAGGPMHSVLLLFLASFGGVLYALPQIAAGKAGRKSHIPFGPFLIVALIVVQLFGTNIIDWYERLLV